MTELPMFDGRMSMIPGKTNSSATKADIPPAVLRMIVPRAVQSTPVKVM